MGDAKTLALIAKAAQKLPRVDPEYAARMKENRQRRHRVRKRVATRELDRSFSKLLKTKGYNTEAFASDFFVESIQKQDNVLSELEKSDFSLQSKAEFKITVKEDRTARLYTYDGLTLNLKQWAERTGIPAGTLYNRLKVGYTVEDAFTRPNNGTEKMRRRVRLVKPQICKARRNRRNGPAGRLYEYDGKLLPISAGQSYTE